MPGWLKRRKLKKEAERNIGRSLGKLSLESSQEMWAGSESIPPKKPKPQKKQPIAGISSGIRF